MGICHHSHQANHRALRLEQVVDDLALPITIYIKRKNHEDHLHREHHDSMQRKHNLKRYRITAYEKDIDDIVASLPKLTVTSREPEMRRVQFIGSIDDLNSTFNIQLNHYKDEYGRDFISHGGPYSLPDSIEEVIEGVLGLNTRPIVPPKKPSIIRLA